MVVTNNTQSSMYVLASLVCMEEELGFMLSGVIYFFSQGIWYQLQAHSSVGQQTVLLCVLKQGDSPFPSLL